MDPPSPVKCPYLRRGIQEERKKEKRERLKNPTLSHL
jgi:hypothetical protein